MCNSNKSFFNVGTKNFDETEINEFEVHENVFEEEGSKKGQEEASQISAERGRERPS